MKQNTIQNIRPLLSALLVSGLLLLSVLLLGAMLSGCVKHELEQRPVPPPAGETGYAEIALDWGGDERPQSARYLFYDQTGALANETTGVTDGVKCALAAGTYRLVVHNEDARQVEYRGTENYQTAEVFAQHTNYSDGHHPAEGVPCILEPQVVFGIGACNEFDELVIEAGKTTRATVTPGELTRQLEFHFTVKGDREVKSLAGVLDGIVPGIFLGSGTSNTSTSCAVEFQAEPETKAASGNYGTRLGVFNLLTTGQSPDGTNSVYVTLVLGDGQKLTTQVDLTPMLREIITDNGGEIPIEIPIEITLEITEIGLDSTVGEWTPGSGGSEDVN